MMYFPRVMQCLVCLSFLHLSQVLSLRVIDCTTDAKLSSQRNKADDPLDCSHAGLQGTFPKSETTIRLNEVKGDEKELKLKNGVKCSSG